MFEFRLRNLARYRRKLVQSQAASKSPTTILAIFLDKLNKHHLTRNLIRRLERLGYAVTTLSFQEKAA
jgi:hypothetical protein